jgi:hypothetical protein
MKHAVQDRTGFEPGSKVVSGCEWVNLAKHIDMIHSQPVFSGGSWLKNPNNEETKGCKDLSILCKTIHKFSSAEFMQLPQVCLTFFFVP